MKAIADTGAIVVLVAADDPAHAWAAGAIRRHSPFYVRKAVSAEANCFFETPRSALRLVTSVVRNWYWLSRLKC